MKSMIVGISGGSGSGKTTIADIVRRAFVPEDVSYLPEDNYYKDFSHIPPDQRAKMNWDSPLVKDLDKLGHDLETLKSGKPISVHEYDFANHKPGPTVTEIKPAAVVLVEGIHCLTSQSIRALLDRSVFVDAGEKDRFDRRLRRDVAERERQPNSVRDQWLDTVQPAYELYVDPCKLGVDLTIRNSQNTNVEAATEPLVEMIAAESSARRA